MTRTSGINQRIADRLLSEGRISGDQHRLAIAHATRHKVRIEDALVELDILKEGAERQAENADDLFAANFTLMSGELAQLLAHLVEALGGEGE